MQIQEVMINALMRNPKHYKHYLQKLKNTGDAGLCPDSSFTYRKKKDPCNMTCYDCKHSDSKDWRVDKC